MAAVLVAAATTASVVIVKTSSKPLEGTNTVDGQPSHVTCETLPRQGKGCHVIVVAGRAFRYSLIRSRTITRVTDLIDVGGPGAAPLGTGYPTAVADLLPGRNILVIDEPWTTASAPAGCDGALTDWYRSLRASWPKIAIDDLDTSSQDIATTCRLGDPDRWALSGATYRKVLRGIATEERLNLDLFIGISFGSVRHQSVADLFRRSILVSPFAPSADAGLYMRLRAAMKQPQPSMALVGEAPAHRSLPLSRLDLAAASDEAMYLSPARRRGVFDLRDAADVTGTLADQLFGRYGTDSISRSILAYWAGTCSALSRWDEVPATAFGTDPRSMILRMCVSSPGASSPRDDRLPGPIACLATSRGDGIVPAALAHGLASRSLRRVVVNGPHGATLGLKQCLSTLRSIGAG